LGKGVFAALKKKDRKEGGVGAKREKGEAPSTERGRKNADHPVPSLSRGLHKSLHPPTGRREKTTKHESDGKQEKRPHVPPP